MSEHLPNPVDPSPATLHEDSTAFWRGSESPAVTNATKSFVLHSTSGPNDALRDTLAKEKEDAVAAPEFPKLPGLLITAYIDHGGMGHVYRAEQKSPRRIVAVKIATAFNRAGLVTRERFDREIQALAAISHPNIMPIYLAGDWHGFPYYAMRYMPGGPLSKQLSRLVGQPNTVVPILRKVASGLQELHEAGLIHRDLKPHNILLDENDEPVIADFGLAKWLDGENADLTVTASALGTKFYMPPEQAAGAKELFGPGCDIWSFGVVMYELLAGRRPFDENDERELSIFEQIKHSAVQFPDSIPAGLATIIRRCLEKRVEDRYPSAAALGADLDLWIEGKEVPRGDAAAQPKPKRRIGRLVGLGLALVLVAGVVLATAAVWPAKKKSIGERLRAGETVTLIGEKGMPAYLGEPISGAEGQFFLADNGYCSLMASGLAVRLLSKEQIDVPMEVSVECAFPDGLFSQNPINKNIYPYSGLIFGYRSTSLEAKPTHHYFQLIQSYELLGTGGSAEFASIQRMHWSPTVNSGFVNLESSSRPMPVATPESGSLDWKRMTVEFRPAEIAANMNGMALRPLRFAGPLWKMGLDPNTEPEVGSAIGISTFLSQAYFRNLKLKPQPQ